MLAFLSRLGMSVLRAVLFCVADLVLVLATSGP
jgi:hypothetical protein